MGNPFSIKTDKYEGRKHLEGSMQPAYSEQETREKFDKEVKHWEGEQIIPGNAVVIILECNEPKHIVEQKTLRG